MRRFLLIPFRGPLFRSQSFPPKKTVRSSSPALSTCMYTRKNPRPEHPSDQALEKWSAVCKKETFLTAGRAAINGGVTLFAAMPNDPMPPDNEHYYARKIAISASSACPVILFGAITASSEPWADIPYKVYLDSETIRCFIHPMERSGISPESISGPSCVLSR